MTSFKAMGVTLKCARFLKIGYVALYHERTILIISEFQYTIGSRPVKMKTTQGVSHLNGIPFSFPIILLSEISQPDYVHVNTCNIVQIMHQNADIYETRYLSHLFQCKPEMVFFSDFLISNDVLGVTLWVRLNMDFKIGCITCK